MRSPSQERERELNLRPHSKERELNLGSRSWERNGNATPLVIADMQLLDKHHNRQMKTFIKHLYNHVALDGIPINLFERNNITRLTSLVHTQLSSPIFDKMIYYA